ncbi:MAG TPA: HEPN domain-containing protein [Mycobacteriales bacterium]|nr:HEPN domain-containing protein [Mycobacteriales bacterium]
MSAGEVRAHLNKAHQFHAAAQFSLDSGNYDAAASDAVLAGIRAADAICVARLGASSRAKQHAAAIGLLKGAGVEGRRAATLLSRLLELKAKAQYDTIPVTADAARRAVESAQKLLDLAREVAAG